jgi:hypothetical protein|tara:strand:- start:787 stop:1365 length:579 start_codon:yes stop_codon:yes gene_type:complete
MRKLFVIIPILTGLLISCSAERNLEKNLKVLDEKYGYCDNPQRSLTDYQYKICKDKERSSSGSEFELSTSITELFNRQQTVISQSNVNPLLWQSSLTVLQPYSLKIVDSNGGYIETDWIYETDAKNQRCKIKVQITSAELITTGVDSTFLCQNKNNDDWVNDKSGYTDESKQLTLAILENAAENLDKKKLEE